MLKQAQLSEPRKIAGLVAPAMQQIRKEKAIPAMPDMREIEAWAKWLRFDLCNDPQLMDMVDGTVKWLKAFRDKKDPIWLTLVGHSENGKSHIAGRIWEWLLAQEPRIDASGFVCRPHKTAACQHEPRIINWTEFLDSDLRQGRMDVFNDISRWPLAVIDDIGAERDTTGFAAEKLYSLCVRRERKWTIITSNSTLEKLSDLDRRIYTRIFWHGNVVVEVNTAEYHARKGVKTV